MDQLPFCLPVCHRICSSELSHHNWRAKSTQKEGQGMIRCFIAFRKQHRNQSNPDTRCDNNTVTISVTPLYISLGWREEIYHPLEKVCAFPPFIFLWQRLGNTLPALFILPFFSLFAQRKATFILFSNIYWSRYFFSLWNISKNAFMKDSFLSLFLLLLLHHFQLGRWVSWCLFPQDQMNDHLKKSLSEAEIVTLNICFLWSTHLKLLLQEYLPCKIISWKITRGENTKMVPVLLTWFDNPIKKLLTEMFEVI